MHFEGSNVYLDEHTLTLGMLARSADSAYEFRGIKSLYSDVH